MYPLCKWRNPYLPVAAVTSSLPLPPLPPQLSPPLSCRMTTQDWQSWSWVVPSMSWEWCSSSWMDGCRSPMPSGTCSWCWRPSSTTTLSSPTWSFPQPPLRTRIWMQLRESVMLWPPSVQLSSGQVLSLLLTADLWPNKVKSINTQVKLPDISSSPLQHHRTFTAALFPAMPSSLCW